MVGAAEQVDERRQVRGHDRDSRGHRLEHHDAEALPGGVRSDEGVDRAQQRPLVRLAHQPEAAALLSASLGVPQPVMAQALARMGYGVAPLTPDVIADQQKIADTLHALGLIPFPITVAEAVWHPGS